jgi:hypothetical protein
MITKISALSAAVALSAAPAYAGSYVNIESNTGVAGGDYKSTLVETHYGYEGTVGEKTTWYVQGGPAFDFQDGGEAENKVSGKVGASVAVTEKTDVYGELSVVSEDDWEISSADLGIKAGVTYRF